MTTKDFINQAIGKLVYIINVEDLSFDGELRKLIYDKTELRLIKWTKSGKLYLHDEINNKYYTVPPSSIREIED